MKLIQAPNRGIAIIGPGYYKSLSAGEEVTQAVNLWGNPTIGNDRQFDVWRAIAQQGTAS